MPFFHPNGSLPNLTKTPDNLIFVFGSNLTVTTILLKKFKTIAGLTEELNWILG